LEGDDSDDDDDDDDDDAKIELEDENGILNKVYNIYIYFKL
jgi:hypothetical protein